MYILCWVQFVSLHSANQAWQKTILPLVAETDLQRPKYMSFNTGSALAQGLALWAKIGNSFRTKLTALVVHDFGKSRHSLSRKLEVMHDNSCILSYTQPHCPSQIKGLDLGNPSQCKVSIQGQMRHVKLGPAKPEVTEVFNPKDLSHKSIQAFIWSHRTDDIIADQHVSSFHLS